ncbi:tyrosine-type recombinase/integrase [Paraburkholderia youngii]|uniref:tyrosine-type recombinase/integrase n=1 Tax=Paraburkholderia youngii TaxID=2782701 RepID=UPI003D215753
MRSEIKRAAVLAPGQIRHVLRVTEATSQQPQRDAVILLLGLSVGMRISEIAQLHVREMMFPEGALRSEVSLTQRITKGGRQRTVYFTSHKLIAAIERYLEFRIERDLGTTLDESRFRGLNPHLPLVLSRKGYPYALNRKTRISASGEEVNYWAADALQFYVTKLYRAAGLKNCSSHSGRRTFATNLLRKGATLEQIQQLLGHQDVDDTLRYVETDDAVLRRAFEDVI